MPPLLRRVRLSATVYNVVYVPGALITKRINMSNADGNGEGAGRVARRELFDTVLRHGSEERTPNPSSPLMDVQTGLTAPPAPLHESTTAAVNGQRRTEDHDAGVAMSDATVASQFAWSNQPITAWNHQLTIEFLECYKVRSEGMQVAISLKWDGRTLKEIIQDPTCDTILRDELGIESPKLNMQLTGTNGV